MSLSCREMTDFILDYLNHELPVREADDFRQHMQDCPECLAYLDSYEKTAKMGKLAHADPDICQDAPEQLIQAILAARRDDP
ncbi:MAG: anti-sigma factor family protein [Acidobacteriota bacterium]